MHDTSIQQAENEWEFANHVIYCITLYTKGNTPWFGALENGRMQLSNVGHIAHNEWLQTPVRRPYIHLDQFTILPESIQMILMVKHRDTSHGPDRITGKSGTLQSIVNYFKKSVVRKCQKQGFKEFAWEEEYSGEQITSLHALERMRESMNQNTL